MWARLKWIQRWVITRDVNLGFKACSSTSSIPSYSFFIYSRAEVQFVESCKIKSIIKVPWVRLDRTWQCQFGANFFLHKICVRPNSINLFSEATTAWKSKREKPRSFYKLWEKGGERRMKKMSTGLIWRASRRDKVFTSSIHCLLTHWVTPFCLVGG